MTAFERFARIGFATALVIFVGCRPVPLAKTSPDQDEVGTLRRVVTEHAAAYERAFPDLVEYLGGRLEHHDTLPDNSLEAVRAWRAREDAWLQALAPMRFAVGTPEWVAHGHLQNTLQSAVATRVCRNELWPAHEFGWQSTLLTILEQQPVGSSVARAEALARWGQLQRFLDTEVANLREGLRQGYTAPRSNVERALAQLDALIALHEDASPLWSPQRRDTDAAFQAQWSRLVQTELLPATERYREFLRDHYAPRARTSLAITGNPHGADCYRAQLRTNTTNRLTPREVYELGEKLVAEREAKVLQLARGLFGDGIVDLRAARTALEADPRNHFASAEEALHFVTQAMARAEQAAPHWFATIPRGGLSLVPYQDFEAKAHPPARYEPAAADGSHPARFRIDLTNFGSLERADLEVTAFHEGIPGHHLQLGREPHSQLGAVDPRGLGAFLEGWARYGELLADEMGIYSSDLDRLGAFAHLPTGLVVDPGVHAMNWSREQAVSWAMSKQVAFSPQEAEAYVDRIAVCPGELLSYGFGEHELRTLLHEARAALGPRFDIKQFHEKLLAHGALPLPMVREIITQWLRNRDTPPAKGVPLSVRSFSGNPYSRKAASNTG